MITNIIIGKQSFVTKALLSFIKKAEVFSANDFDITTIKKIQSKKKINLIFNNFYPSKLLNSLTYKDYERFEKLSLESLISVLSKVSPRNINKIIYTSSAAVYRLPDNMDSQKKDILNRELYSSFKLASEKIVLNYCTKNNINYHIFRLFNSFGDSQDPFSFIEKIVDSKKKNKKITLINNGNSIRDFIHVDDIGKIYNIFLTKKINNGIFDLGTGNGYLIRDIVNFIKFPIKNIKKKNNIEEIHNSIADKKNLQNVISKYKFKDIETYLKKKLSIKNKEIIKSITNFKNKNRRVSSGVVIYGAGYAGKKIYSALNNINEDTLFFVDDKISIQNTSYEGIPIISYENLLEIYKNYNIKKVYLTIPSLSKKLQNQIIKKIKKNFFDVRYLTEKKFLLSDKIDVNDLNINEINNILNRKQKKKKKIRKLSNKTILVTGAAGTIGSEICRQLIQHNVKKIIAVDKSELGIYNHQKKINKEKIHYKLLDINDKIFLEKIIKDENIEIIFHAAAYKHVNILENNIFSAVKNNIFATYNICDLSKKYSCEMIFISTDKAANPTSVLGYTKRVAEKVCEYFNSYNLIKNQIKIVRFGNVFGSSGSAINSFIDKINNEKPVEITSKKASRYFMTVLEACHLVLQTSAIKTNEKIFILNMGRPINIFKLASNLAKIKMRLNPKYKFEYKEIGLYPGEKLNETLRDRSEIIKKVNKEIFAVVNKKRINNDFIKHYEKLIFYYSEIKKKELISSLKKISRQ
jgi:FlaA1/EpsC-like NDP-sugar epimerase